MNKGKTNKIEGFYATKYLKKSSNGPPFESFLKEKNGGKIRRRGSKQVNNFQNYNVSSTKIMQSNYPMGPPLNPFHGEK